MDDLHHAAHEVRDTLLNFAAEMNTDIPANNKEGTFHTKCQSIFKIPNWRAYQKVCWALIFWLTGFTVQNVIFAYNVLYLLVEQWKKASDPQDAAVLFKRHLLKEKEENPKITAIIDIWQDQTSQSREITSFYKRPQIDWAGPFRCSLQGNAYGEA